MTGRHRSPLHAWLAAVVVVAALGLAAGPSPARAQVVFQPLPFESHAQEVRFQKLTRELRCLVCQDESLAASQAKLAVQMRRIIFAQMQKGWSNEQIKQYLVERYSAYVLYKPPLNPGTWLLWFGPPVILLLGAGVVVAVVRKRRADAPQAVPEADEDDW